MFEIEKQIFVEKMERLHISFSKDKLKIDTRILPYKHDPVVLQREGEKIVTEMNFL